MIESKKCICCGEEIKQLDHPMFCYVGLDEDGNEHTVCGSCVEKRIKEILKNEENKNG